MGLMGRYREARKKKSVISAKIKRGYDRTIGDTTPWEERQAEKLQKMRTQRIKQEGRAKLRSAEDRERTEISKARGTGRGSSILAGLQTAGGAISDYYNPPATRRTTKKRSTGSSSNYVIVAGKAYPKGGTAKKSRKTRKRSRSTGASSVFGDFGF